MKFSWSILFIAIPLLTNGFVPATAAERDEILGSLSSAARDKVSAAFLNKFGRTRSREGYIVEFESRDVRSQADQDRLTLGLQDEDRWIIERKAAAFEIIKQRVFSAFSQRGIRALTSFRNLPLAHIQITEMESLADFLDDEAVVGVYPNEKHEANLTESLPLIGQMSVGFDGNGTTVAVLDTGVNYTHSAFGFCSTPGSPTNCRVIHAQDFAREDYSLDSNGHGTFVAGIVASVAPRVKIAALDVFDGSTAWASDIIAAIDWAIEHQAEYNIVAMNLSLGNGSPNYTECPLTWAATPFASARAAGILPIVASGNEGFPNAVASPACTPGAVRVGAVYDDDLGWVGWRNCTDSNAAADDVVCFSNSADILTIFAPGAIINAAGYSGGGTSMSAPHVAGGVAVLRDAFPEDTVQQTVDRMVRTGVMVTDANEQGSLPSITKPRLDLDAAVGETQSGSMVEVGHTPDVVTDGWYQVDLEGSYATAPVVIVSLETYDGSNTAGLRVRDVGTASFQVKVEEEQSRDPERGHTTEVVGFLIADAGSINDRNGIRIGEAGKVSREQVDGSRWHTVNLADIYADPVAIMNMATFSGSQPAHIRLRSVGTGSFQFQIEEWDYLDGYHVQEEIHYVVLESGSHELPSGRRFEVGTIQGNHEYKSVSYSFSLRDAAVLSQCQTYNGSQAVVTRQTNANASGFSLRLQEEEGNDGWHYVETIGYIAIE